MNVRHVVREAAIVLNGQPRMPRHFQAKDVKNLQSKNGKNKKD